MAAQPSWDDSLRQVFRKVLLQNKHHPYVFLLQHSLSTAIRLQQAGMAVGHHQHYDDAALYHGANLRTPQECAARDWQTGNLWIEHIVSRILLPLIKTEKEPRRRLIWLQTSPRPVPSWLEQPQQQSLSDSVHVINVSSNPFGWEVEEETASDKTVNLTSLWKILMAVREAAVITTVQDPPASTSSEPSTLCWPVVIESVTPLVRIHGFPQTMKFLRQVALMACPMILPVLSEGLSPQEHRILEDFAQAVLWLHDGEATLLRQGIRQRDNLVRETIPYEMDNVDDPVLGNMRLQLGGPPAPEVNEDEIIEEHESGTDVGSNQRSSRPNKVQLKLEEEDKEESSQVKGPRILVDDDDPEFEDYDEEDPDDDLDI